jgi:hypothetical protein
MYICKLCRAFRRDPDFGGFKGWLEANTKGTTQQAMLTTFLNSPDFKLAYGTLNDEQFVNLVYLLRRAGSTDEVTAWKNLLDGGTVTLEGAIGGFINAPEYKLRFQ